MKQILFYRELNEKIKIIKNDKIYIKPLFSFGFNFESVTFLHDFTDRKGTRSRGRK